MVAHQRRATGSPASRASSSMRRGPPVALLLLLAAAVITQAQVPGACRTRERRGGEAGVRDTRAPQHAGCGLCPAAAAAVAFGTAAQQAFPISTRGAHSSPMCHKRNTQTHHIHTPFPPTARPDQTTTQRRRLPRGLGARVRLQRRRQAVRRGLALHRRRQAPLPDAGRLRVVPPARGADGRAVRDAAHDPERAGARGARRREQRHRR